MCSGSKSKACETGGVIMEGEFEERESSAGIKLNHCSSLLLELSATDDLEGFKHLVEEEGRDFDEVGIWYVRKVGSKKMAFEERTPLMVAAMFGSKNVLNYILQKGCIDVNRACGSDGITALHCAASSGSILAYDVIKLLLDSSADVNRCDSNRNRPCDVIAPCFNSSSKLKRRTLEKLLMKGDDNECEEVCLDSNQVELDVLSPKSSNDGSRNGSEKKEYPVDPSLPDIKTGIYGTDEFRMYTFKIKPCSRAYSHDWTECPFVHPGENARRRDPRKYHYSCVPCPEFRKGSCPKGDVCEYAHGIFECWLHPAQYRTRLCKDETNCTRRVCFFAHKPEELRPLYASTGSAVPSPRSYSSSVNTFDMGPISPLGLGSPSMIMPSTSTPPMTPTGASSPIGGASNWPNHLNNITPPTLQLPSSRLKAALSARDMDLKVEFHRQQLMDELAGLSLSSPSGWTSAYKLSPGFATSGDQLGSLKPNNLDPSLLAQAQLNHHQLNSSYSCGSPVSNPRLAAFAKRSQSFIDRAGVNRLSSASPNAMVMPPHLSDWGSPDGKLDWGVQGDELHKLRKSASFGFRTNGTQMGVNPNSGQNLSDEPDVSWVQSLVKDAPTSTSAQLGFEEQLNQQYDHLNNNGSKMIPPWVEQMYMEQEPMAA